ncbi:MAG: polysaccharide biosynthesis tyrosine autokinase, partial [Chitinophagaceae bacterium]|nr:polysaccharide biosynthesis tyrosine autokinase [Chitinophagaceae bacterium]
MQQENQEFQIAENNSQDSTVSSFNIKFVIAVLFNHWMWFLLSLTICFLIAFVYLRYQSPIFEMEATVLVHDDKQGGTELSALQQLGLVKGSGATMANELEIYKSRFLMTRVVRELDLQVMYFTKGNVIDREVFKQRPFKVIFLTKPELFRKMSGTMSITIKSPNSFEIKDKLFEGEKLFGDTVKTSLGWITLKPELKQIKTWLNREIKLKVSPEKSTVNRYLSSLSLKPVNKTSNVVLMTLRDRDISKGQDVLNNLIKQRNEDAIEDKNLISRNTSDFINERLAYITSELADVEGQEQGFKQSHNIVDLEAQARMSMESDRQVDQKLTEMNTQFKLAEYVYNYVLAHNNNTDLVPANLGLQDMASSGYITQINQLILERNKLLKSSTEANPVIETIDEQISSLRQNLVESISNYKSTLSIRQRDLSSYGSGFSSKMASVPSETRQSRSIERQKQIKEQLYLYLLQKREETNISLAATVASVKVIDEAYSNGVVVSPDKKNIYTAAFVMGLFLPALLIYLKQLLDTKVHGKRDLERLNIPFIGDIPKHDEEDERLVVTKGENSNVAESFRLLRTNLEFLLSKHQKDAKIIFITSTLAKEGKSFVALNLASTISLTGKRVLLVGLDLRAPKILEYVGLDERKGITNYISEQDLRLEDVILKRPLKENIDFLPSGDIPPNPAELLLHPRVDEMFKTIAQMYDYIIVDTAPVGLVTDTLLVSHYADSFIYVVRTHVLDKRLLHIPHAMYLDKR